MPLSEIELINEPFFEECRDMLGSSFVRILGYFREDGKKAIDQIEEAMRAKNAAALVAPAHKLKGEAMMLGAARLGTTAEKIEFTARICVERHDTPDDILELVVSLRPTFEQTLAFLEKDASPLVQQRTPQPPQGFGRRMA